LREKSAFENWKEGKEKKATHTNELLNPAVQGEEEEGREVSVDAVRKRGRNWRTPKFD
jgi:heme-degrading monooxygenase HmoA